MKTEIGCKRGRAPQPVREALSEWLADLDANADKTDEFNIMMAEAARFILSSDTARLFYYVPHNDPADAGIYIGADLSDENAVEMKLRFNWDVRIEPHSEIAFV